MKRLPAGLILAFFCASASAQPIADSVSGFSNVQGANNWHYGYYNVTADTTPGYDPEHDFTPFPVFEPGNLGSPAWRIGSFWTEVTATSAHPHAGDAQEHWAIRRWISGTTGLVRISGHLAKHSAGGNGVRFTVYINGRKVFERLVSGGDTAGSGYSFGVGLKEGDRVDFAVDAAGDIFYDTLVHSIQIEPAEWVMTSATAIEIGTPTVPGTTYQLLRSPDLANWSPVAAPFVGTGDTLYHLFSTREFGTPGYFKAEVVPE
ncbi:MAG: hypothetical protein KF833_04570 [Verrucomicrobiae bacterium]|nr:hypothetical protein [Verrucomicrobiae bacterium]